MDAPESLADKLKAKSIYLISTTSIHGIVKLYSSKHTLEKLVWLAAILASFCYCLSYIATNVSEYLEYRVASSIQIKSEHNSEFPTVMFCNSNRSKIVCEFEKKDCFNIRRYGENCTIFNYGYNVSRNNTEFFDFVGIENTNRTGYKWGLNLTLYPVSDKAIEIYIYNFSTNRDVNKVIKLSGRSETSLVLSRTLYNKLSYPYSNCKAGYSFKLGYNDRYNRTVYPYYQTNCFITCEYQRHWNFVISQKNIFKFFNIITQITIKCITSVSI